MNHYFQNTIQNTRFNDATGQLLHIFTSSVAFSMSVQTIAAGQIATVLASLTANMTIVPEATFDTVLNAAKETIIVL
jgi:hypothetical protein